MASFVRGIPLGAFDVCSLRGSLTLRGLRAEVALVDVEFTHFLQLALWQVVEILAKMLLPRRNLRLCRFGCPEEGPYRCFARNNLRQQTEPICSIIAVSFQCMSFGNCQRPNGASLTLSHLFKKPLGCSTAACHG